MSDRWPKSFRNSRFRLTRSSVRRSLPFRYRRSKTTNMHGGFRNRTSLKTGRASPSNACELCHRALRLQLSRSGLTHISAEWARRRQASTRRVRSSSRSRGGALRPTRRRTRQPQPKPGGEKNPSCELWEFNPSRRCLSLKLHRE